MSGVVIKLDDDDEDDDVAELLATMDDDDDDDDGRTSRGRKRFFKTSRDVTAGVKSGTVAQMLTTLCLFFMFFGLGLTKSLLDAQIATDGLTQKEVSSYVGYFLGFVIGGAVFAKFSHSFVLLLAMVLLGISLFVLPFASSEWNVDSVYGAVGVLMAVLMVGGNVTCLGFWGKRSGPYLQALHFCLSLGFLTGTSLVDPLVQTRLPSIVQKALELSPGNQSYAAVGSNHHVVKRAAEHQTHDPLLTQIFEAVAEEPKTASRAPKPKPTFTDGRKLDNSVDWDLVKVAQPPPEEVNAPSTTTALLSTSTPIKSSIQEELDDLEDDIRANEELREWLKSGRRVKRGLGRNQGIGFGNYGPPIYSQPRVPAPRKPQKYWPTAGADFPAGRYDWQNIPNYDEQQRLPPMYGSRDYADPMPANGQTDGRGFDVPAPPENVAKAIETIERYMENPNDKNVETTTTTTSTTASTTTTAASTAGGTTATTASTTAAAAVVTRTSTAPVSQTSKERHNHHRKKPESSFNNDTGPAEENYVTIGKVLNKYGVLKSNWGFVLDATYLLFLSIFLLLCMCYKPREPRSRHQDAMGGQPGVKENRVFKASLTLLLFFLNAFQWFAFVSFDQGLPHLQSIYTSSSVSMQKVFVGVFALTRFLSIFTVGVAGAAITITLSLAATVCGSVAFVVSHQMLPTMPEAGTATAWTSIVLMAVGLSAILPCMLSWAEAYMLMSSEVVAAICWALSLAELIGRPDIVTFVTDDIEKEDAYMEFGVLVASLLALSTFVLAYVLARRHGTRSSRPQSSGYELANQDDIGQELLDDEDDDFEVSEPTSSRTEQAGAPDA